VSRPRDLDGLPERIAAVRVRLGLAQGRFAARVGVSRNALLRYEGGHGRPRADTLERIAQLGGVSVDWLLRGDRRPPEGPATGTTRPAPAGGVAAVAPRVPASGWHGYPDSASSSRD
jgi:transcriptional regulator with XRE-family HTH domain